MSHNQIRVGGEKPLLGSESLTTTKMKGHLRERTVSTCCLKKPQLGSKWTLAALAVLLVVGLGVAGVGATGFFAQQHMLPAVLAKLNVLGAIGQTGAYAMMGGGGVLTLLAIGLLIAAVKRACANKQQIKRVEPKKVETESPIDLLPENLRKAYKNLEKGQAIFIPVEGSDRIDVVGKPNDSLSSPLILRDQENYKAEILGKSEGYTLINEKKLNLIPVHLREAYKKLNPGHATVIMKEDGEHVDVIGKPKDSSLDPKIMLNLEKDRVTHMRSEFEGYFFTGDEAPELDERVPLQFQTLYRQLNPGELRLIPNSEDDKKFDLVAKPLNSEDEPIVMEKIDSSWEDLKSKFPDFKLVGKI